MLSPFFWLVVIENGRIARYAKGRIGRRHKDF